VRILLSGGEKKEVNGTPNVPKTFKITLKNDFSCLLPRKGEKALHHQCGLGFRIFPSRTAYFEKMRRKLTKASRKGKINCVFLGESRYDPKRKKRKEITLKRR